MSHLFNSFIISLTEQQAEILPVIAVENEAGSLGGTIASAPTTTTTVDPTTTTTDQVAPPPPDDELLGPLILDPLAEASYPDDPTDVDDPNYLPQLDPNR